MWPADCPYDALAESVSLIERRHVEAVRHLGPQQPFAAVAVDVADDVAVTMFARRPVDQMCCDTYLLLLRQGRWSLHSGSSGNVDADLLADRPAALRHDLRRSREALVSGDPTVMSLDGSSGDRDTRTHWRAWTGRQIGHAAVRVTEQVGSIVAGGRVLPVPWHGHVVIAWAGHRPPHVIAWDQQGQPLCEARLASPGSIPM